MDFSIIFRTACEGGFKFASMFRSFDLFCLINAISGGNTGDKIVRAIIAFGGRIGNGNLDSTDDV